MDDTISRKLAIDALWKALYEYEDKTEKQFLESEELDVADWFLHRNFVQNMSDIDRQTLLDLPSAQPEIIYCKDCKHNMNSPEAGNACCDIFYGMTDQNGFCHMGERRTDDLHRPEGI